MAQITWNTEVNAPCCPGEILGPNGQSVLIQTDWDYPGVASSFGWNIADVGDGSCQHESTDGTIDCRECNVTVGDFITAALEWLDDHHGATADDPGYFDNDF